jgi:hypothetical protein
MGARDRDGRGLSYRPARACIFKPVRSHGIDSKELRPAAYVAWRPVRKPYSYSVPRPIDGLKTPAQDTKAGGIDSLESIPELLKSLKIPPL